ncbi:hypothetical protein ACHQM5_004950 [Ranunculus cassubicifolius]
MPTIPNLSSPLWSISEISEAINGRILKWGPPGTITTDTRSLNLNPQNQWFLAIPGKQFNGHDFIRPDLGCIGVIGTRVCENWNKGFVKFENSDTLIALEKLGVYGRKRFGGIVVGITGSVGKTTTREMTALIVEKCGGKVCQTKGNENNEIGVALTLIGIPGNADVVIVEMRMCRKGEILKLVRMCRPEIRVILNVEPCHLENFGGLEDIASAKGEMLSEMKPGDVCVLNGDDPLVMKMHVPHGVKKVLFGRRIGCDMRLVSAESTDRGRVVQVVLEWNFEMVEFVIPSPGLHLALNACAAAAVSVVLGVPLPQIALSLSKFTPVQMRSELIIAKNGIQIINDVYNANPTSTLSAIDSLKAIECRGKRVAILGDMLELGSTEASFHETVLGLCCVQDIGLVGLVGKNFLAAANKIGLLDRMTKVVCALDVDSLAINIVECLETDDVVLVKGSRGMKMERVVDAIKACRG